MLTHIMRRLGKAGSAAKKEAGKTAETIFRMGVTSIVLSFVGLLFFSAVIPKPKPIEKGSTLYVEIDRPLSTASPYDGMPQWQFFIGSQTVSATSIAGAIDQAAADRRIERLILDLDGMNGSPLGAAQVIKDAVENFREAGKPASVYATSYDNAQYLIASASDEIMAHPGGSFTAGTMRAGGLYMGDAFERYGVEVITGRAGRYKSAIEPYTRGSMSDEAREATQVFLEGRLAAYQQSTRADGFSNLAFPDDVSEAVAAERAGLIDRTITTPDLMTFAFGNGDLTDFPYATLGAYWGAKKKPDTCQTSYDRWEFEEDPRFERSDQSSRIGLLYLEGTIVRGDGEQGIIGDVATTQKLEQMIRNTSIEALVIRIDSPGGDAIASEIIRSEIEAFKATGRPVIISMGGLAASGGYWIASIGNTIFAEPTTLTGSIGVFSLRTSGAGVLEGLGVSYDGVQLGADRGFGSVLEPIAAGEQERLQVGVERIYGEFTELVSKARDLDVAGSSDWAEGRVWSANHALDLGLIDRVGTLNDALQLASDLTDIPTSCTFRAKSRSRAGNLLAEVLAVVTPRPSIPLPDEFRTIQAMMSSDPAVWAYCANCGQ